MIIATKSLRYLTAEKKLSKWEIQIDLFTYLFSKSFKALWLEAAQRGQKLCQYANQYLLVLRDNKPLASKYQLGKTPKLKRAKDVQYLAHYAENIAAFP